MQIRAVQGAMARFFPDHICLVMAARAEGNRIPNLQMRLGGRLDKGNG
jgi:hypothetical protein